MCGSATYAVVINTLFYGLSLVIPVIEKRQVETLTLQHQNVPRYTGYKEPLNGVLTWKKRSLRASLGRWLPGAVLA